jgi:hypothetical protein
VRRWLIGFVLAAFALTGCKDVKPGPSELIRGSQGVAVSAVKVFQTSGGTSTGTQATYVVARLTFENTLGYDTTPEPKNFVLTDSLGQQYAGVDTGDSALVGISNYGGVVKKGASQEYTIAFRVPANTSGSIFYSPF